MGIRSLYHRADGERERPAGSFQALISEGPVGVAGALDVSLAGGCFQLWRRQKQSAFSRYAVASSK